MKEQAGAYKLETDERLMELLSSGETAAFDELYKRYSKRILYYFYRMLGHSNEKAQDFLQDLFLKIIENPKRFDPKRRFSTWVFSVAHNMCKNEYRKLEVRKVMDHQSDVEVLGVPQDAQDRKADLNAFNQRLFQELELMDEDRRSAFLLRHREGFSVREISEVMQCSEGTVKSRVFYANKKLSEKLGAFRSIVNGS